MAIASINPATGETLRAFEPHATAEVERRVALAASLFAAGGPPPSPPSAPPGSCGRPTCSSPANRSGVAS